MNRRSTVPADPDDAEAATSVALRILNGAAQTEVSLRRRLQQRGFGASAIQAAVVKAAECGYIDDESFARSLAGRRLARGYGRAAVAHELRSRGVAERPLEDTLRSVGLDDERASATRVAAVLWERDLRRRPEDDGRRAYRVAGTLSRRGFGVETIRHALRTIADGISAES